jgi:hypothetical protein
MEPTSKQTQGLYRLCSDPVADNLISYPKVVFDKNIRDNLVIVTLAQNPEEEDRKACDWDLVPTNNK